MKRMILRIVSLGLALLLYSGAAAGSMDDLSYSMADKLMKQLSAGSGFIGTLTLTANALEGRESDAFSTAKPLVLDLTYIKVPGDDAVPDEARLQFSLNASEYQQGSMAFSLRDGAVYMQSSLLADGWYLLGEDVLAPLLEDIGVQDALPAASELTQAGGMMSGTLQFFTSMAAYLIGASTDRITEAMQQYLTKIDFWLEGYRDSVQMTSLDDGTSVVEIGYRLSPAAVKSQLKQLLVDLMNDEALLTELSSLMPDEQSALYLEPSLQPYYFYAVDELPLEGDMTIRRVLSLLGDTIELSVIMPLYDSVSGAMTLEYTRMQGGEDMPYENTLNITGEDSFTELNYRTYDTMNGTTVYQGTILVQGAQEDGVKPQTLWASFDLSSLSVTTKDLNGYETLRQSLKLSVAPVEISGAEDAAQYTMFSKTDFTLDMRFASLAAKSASTDVDLTLDISGEGMAQAITLVLSGSTTALWTPETFDQETAVNLAEMPADELQSLLSQAMIKGGLLVLPYINLPQVQPDNPD